jgi:virulence-associated protein VagC
MEMVINRQILPEPIFSYLHSEKVRLLKEDDNIILTPIKNKPNVNELRGMFSDGKISTDDFIAQKALEKEIEL